MGQGYSGTVWKRSGMGFKFNERYIKLTLPDSVAPSLSSSSSAASLVQTLEDDVISMTMPSAWTIKPVLQIWNSQQDCESAPTKPKYTWYVCGVRCASSAIRSALSSPASVDAANHGAQSSSSASEHQHELEILVSEKAKVTPKMAYEPFGLDSTSELQMWALQLMRYLTAANDFPQAIRLLALASLPAAPKAPKLVPVPAVNSVEPATPDPVPVSDSAAMPPSRWYKETADDGQVYYSHAETMETVWELPPNGVLIDHEDLPSRWYKETADDGQVFYSHVDTMETVWELPLGGIVVDEIKADDLLSPAESTAEPIDQSKPSDTPASPSENETDQPEVTPETASPQSTESESTPSQPTEPATETPASESKPESQAAQDPAAVETPSESASSASEVVLAEKAAEQPASTPEAQPSTEQPAAASEYEASPTPAAESAVEPVNDNQQPAAESQQPASDATPAAVEAVPSADGIDGAAPESRWYQEMTDDGKVYYSHVDTMETVWELPPGGVVVGELNDDNLDEIDPMMDEPAQDIAASEAALNQPESTVQQPSAAESAESAAAEQPVQTDSGKVSEDAPMPSTSEEVHLQSASAAQPEDSTTQQPSATESAEPTAVDSPVEQPMQSDSGKAIDDAPVPSKSVAPEEGPLQSAPAVEESTPAPAEPIPASTPAPAATPAPKSEPATEMTVEEELVDLLRREIDARAAVAGADEGEKLAEDLGYSSLVYSFLIEF
jgi:hypothetical protein